MPHAHSSLVPAPVLGTVCPIGCGSGYCGLGTWMLSEVHLLSSHDIVIAQGHC